LSGQTTSHPQPFSVLLVGQRRPKSWGRRQCTYFNVYWKRIYAYNLLTTSQSQQRSAVLLNKRTSGICSFLWPLKKHTIDWLYPQEVTLTLYILMFIYMMYIHKLNIWKLRGPIAIFVCTLTIQEFWKLDKTNMFLSQENTQLWRVNEGVQCGAS